MAETSVQLSTELVINEAAFNRTFNKVAKKFERIQVGVDDRLTGPLGRVIGQTKNFEKAIGAATDRVVAFGAAASAFYAVQKSIDALVRSTVDVEASLARININLNESQEGLKKFGAQIFAIARNTGQTFDEAAKGAEELARQGLGATETLKRLNDALILNRQTGLGVAESVSAITAAINSFTKEALDSTSVVNKLAAVDQKFAVSSKDLAEGIARAGSTASDAGVSFNELLGLITAVQQTTQRGGSVIGNSFKTFFAKLSDKSVLDNLERIGLGVRNISGEALPATQILENLGRAYGGLSDVQKKLVNDNVGTLFQINSLRAVLSDVGDEFGIVARATDIANRATDQAIQKNTKLNETLQSSFNSLKQSVTEVLANLGNINIGPILSGITKGVDAVAQSLGSSDSGSEAGKSIGQGILQGISNVLTGPGLVLIGQLILKTGFAIAKTVTTEFSSLVKINNVQETRAVIQSRINAALAKSTDLEYAQFLAAKSVAEQQKVVLSIVERINAELLQASLRGVALNNSFVVPSGGVVGRLIGKAGVKRGLGNITPAAGGLLPAIQGEQHAIRNGIGGASPSSRPVVIPNFSFGGGKKGTVVANSSEYIIPNYANGGSAIFNPDMVRNIGLPFGAKHLADGFIPNFASMMGFRKGAYPLGEGAFGKVLSNPKRSGLVFKEFESERDVIGTGLNSIENEYVMSKMLERAGVPVARVFGTLSGSKRRGGIFKEKVRGFDGVELSDAMGYSFTSEVIGKMKQKVKAAGIEPFDLHTRNFIVPGDIGDYLKKSEMGVPRGDLAAEIAATAKIVDPGMFNATDYTQYNAVKASSRARGFIPNFVNPIDAAFNRELKAGAPLSSIYVDKDARVAGPGNPTGLLVANLRDEPNGPERGISRVLRQGGDPRFAGLAGGYVPNFANQGAPLLPNVPFNSSFQSAVRSVVGNSQLRQLTGRGRESRFVSEEILGDINAIYEDFKRAVTENSAVKKRIAQKEIRKLKLTSGSVDSVFTVFEAYEKQAKSDFAAQTAIQRSITKNQKKQAVLQDRAARTAEKIAMAKLGERVIDTSAFDAVAGKLTGVGGKDDPNYALRVLGIGRSRELADKESAARKLNKKDIARELSQDSVRELQRGATLSYATLKQIRKNAVAEVGRSSLFAGLKPSDIQQNPELRKRFSAEVAQRAGVIEEQNRENRRAILTRQLAQRQAARTQQASGVLGDIGLLGSFGSRRGDIEKLRRELGIKNPTRSRDISALLESRENQRLQRRSQLGFGLSIASSFGAGLVQPTADNLGRTFGFKTGGGTTAGKIAGGLEGGLQGVGFAALLTSNPYVLAGVAVAGGLIGALGKATKTAEEFAEEMDKSNAVYARNVDAVERVIAITNQEKEIGPNASPAAIRRLAEEKVRAAASITDKNDRNALLSGKLSDRETQELLIRNADRQFRGVSANSAARTASQINSPSALKQIADFFGQGPAYLNPVGAALSPLLGATDRAFTNPLTRINQSNDLAGSLSNLITKDNIGGLQGKGFETFINRVSSGNVNVNPESDVARVKEALVSIGAIDTATQVAADNVIDFAAALKRATTLSKAESAATEEVIKKIREQARAQGFKGAFAGASIFGESSFGNIGAQQRAISLGAGAGRPITPLLKRESFLDFINEFKGQLPAGTVGAEETFFGGEKGKKYIEDQQALSELDKVYASAAQYLKGLNPAGRYTDFSGKAIRMSVDQGLQYQKGSFDADRRYGATAYSTLIDSKKTAVSQTEEARKKEQATADAKAAKEKEENAAMVKQLQEVTQKTAELLANSVLKINLSVQGLADNAGNAEFVAQLQALMQAVANLNNKVDKNAGKPNPPMAIKWNLPTPTPVSATVARDFPM